MSNIGRDILKDEKNMSLEKLYDEISKRIIREYESGIVRNGFTRKDALNTFRSFQRMKSLDYNKKKLLKI